MTDAVVVSFESLRFTALIIIATIVIDRPVAYHQALYLFVPSIHITQTIKQTTSKHCCIHYQIENMPFAMFRYTLVES